VTAIPNTPLTQRLRSIWSCADGHEPWEQWYARHCQGGTANGRAVAAVLFDRARRYWPDFYSPADLPAVAAWADLIDRCLPLVTPEVIEQAVDDVHAVCAYPCPAHFLRAAQQLMEGTTR